ncbi:hypothetical protein scyTo_0011192 [Scyliorhinus torazame]|uniref:Uncharacterized protein n=1 Tax=Scyliorhinus torazame TaxID=75743 RepID=A0A401NIT5_SCYTO|nr:hypothetical protein [Scyliorhinus torazame]
MQKGEGDTCGVCDMPSLRRVSSITLRYSAECERTASVNQNTTFYGDVTTLRDNMDTGENGAKPIIWI